MVIEATVSKQAYDPQANDLLRVNKYCPTRSLIQYGYLMIFCCTWMREKTIQLTQKTSR